MICDKTGREEIQHSGIVPVGCLFPVASELDGSYVGVRLNTLDDTFVL